MHLTATPPGESAISGEDFRSTMRRSAHGFCSTSDAGPDSIVGAASVVTEGGWHRIEGVVRGHLMTHSVDFLLADQGSRRVSTVADGSQQ
jgi:hypothetical protein